METNQGTTLESSTTVNLTFSELPALTGWADAFLRAKAAERLSPGTLHSYCVKLKNFLAWCDKRNILDVEAITPTNLRDFLLSPEDGGHNAGGIHGHYRAVRTFLRWYVAEVELENRRNPYTKGKAPKLEEESLDAVSLEDVEKLHKAAGHARRAEGTALSCLSWPLLDFVPASSPRSTSETLTPCQARSTFGRRRVASRGMPSLGSAGSELCVCG